MSVSTEMLEKELTHEKPKIFRFKNPIINAKIQQALELKRATDNPSSIFTVSERSKNLFSKGKGGIKFKDCQGFAAFLNLETMEIELIPAWNQGDNKAHTAFFCDIDQKYYGVESAFPLGTNTGDVHTRGLVLLDLMALGGIHGKVLGFGLFKGKKSLIRDIRNRSSSQNTFAIEWDPLFLLLNYSKEYEFQYIQIIKKSIPKEIMDEINLALLDLPLDDEKQLRIIKFEDFQNADFEVAFQSMSEEEVKTKLLNNLKDAVLKQDKDYVSSVTDFIENSPERLNLTEEERIEIYYSKISAGLYKNFFDLKQGAKRYNLTFLDIKNKIVQSLPAELIATEEIIDVLNQADDIEDLIGNINQDNYLSFLKIGIHLGLVPEIVHFMNQIDGLEDLGANKDKMLNDLLSLISTINSNRETFVPLLDYCYKKNTAFFHNEKQVESYLVNDLDAGILKWFLNKKLADKNQILFHAAKAGKIQLMENLVQMDADINFQSIAGTTPLSIALVNNKPRTALEILMMEKLDKTILNLYHFDNNNTPLHIACEKSLTKKAYVGVVNKLLEMGANPNIKNLNELTPLNFFCKVAKQKLNNEVIVNLIDRGADLNTVDKEGNSPLLNALLNGNESLAHLLILPHTNLNLKNNQNDTALSVAIKNGQKKTIDFLILNGALNEVTKDDLFQYIKLSNEYNLPDLSQKLLFQLESTAPFDFIKATGLNKITIEKDQISIDPIISYLKKSSKLSFFSKPKELKKTIAMLKDLTSNPENLLKVWDILNDYSPPTKKIDQRIHKILNYIAAKIEDRIKNKEDLSPAQMEIYLKIINKQDSIKELIHSRY